MLNELNQVLQVIDNSPPADDLTVAERREINDIATRSHWVLLCFELKLSLPGPNL